MTSTKLTTFGNYPHFDDFDPYKNYYRVLFKPGLSVQTRELNTLQSMLQDQIGNLAEASIKDKQAVVGGKINLNNSVSFLKLVNGSVLSRSIPEYSEEVQFVTDEGIRGLIQFAIDATEDSPVTLYVKYNVAAEQTGNHVPASGTEVTLLFPDGNTELLQVASGESYSGLGTVAELPESVYYIKKTLVRVPRQVLVLERYNAVDIKNYNVGVLINERVISAQEDPSLYDNALGTPNEMAPGADRYLISGILAEKSTVPPELIDNFIEIIKSVEGVVAVKPIVDAPKPEVPLLLEMLARRTFDESGDYVVDTFDLDIRQHLKTGNNNGVYTFNNDGKEEKLVAQLDPGVAYIRGHEVRISQTTYLDLDKARDTKVMENSYTNPNFNNYLIVENTTGSITPGDTIKIESSNSVSMGTALVHGVEALDKNRIKLYASIISGNISPSTAYYVKGTGYNTALVNFSSSIAQNGYRLNNGYYPLVKSLPYGFSQTTKLNNCVIYKSFATTVTSSNEISLANEDPTELFTNSNSSYYVYIKGHNSGNPKTADVVDADMKQVRLDVSNLVNGSIVGTLNVVVVAKVNVRNPRFKTKTRTTRVETVSGSSFVNSRRARLTKADGYRLVKVTDTTQNNMDVTTKFGFDGGSRDTHYENASIELKSGLSIPTVSSYRVEYEYFEHSATGDFFTVDSYGQIPYGDIPTYVASTGQAIFLGGAYDYRPAVAVGTDGTINSVNKQSRGFVALDEEVISDITYYLTRQDRIMVTSSGYIQIVRGTPDFEPVLPPELDDGITLYKLAIMPYTFTINDVVSAKLNHKRYTMKDIGRLEARLSTVEEVALLNKLESDTAAINFADRFKSGYVVDNFAESYTGDVESPHWGVAYDLIDPSIRPKTISDFIELRADMKKSAGVKYHASSGIITLDYTVEDYIVQDLASDIVLLQPYMVYGWGEANLTIKPNTDIWKESYTHTENLYTSNTNRLDDILIKTSQTNVFDNRPGASGGVGPNGAQSISKTFNAAAWAREQS